MEQRTCRQESYWMFEYMYRDAGNWKTRGALLLTGRAARWELEIRECLEWGDQFVAEQVGVPSLCPEHFASVGEGPTDLDHAYHEFVRVRPAAAEEAERMSLTASASGFLERMRAAKGRWDVTLSPNRDL